MKITIGWAKIYKQRIYFIALFFLVVSVFSLTRFTPVQAAACISATATVTQTSSPVFYVDTTNGYPDAYASYRVNTGASGSFSDLWVKVDTFTNTALLGLAPTEDGLYHVGALSSNSSANAYFDLKGAVTASAQSYTLHLYNGKPGTGGTETCSSSQSNSSVASTIQSGNNTVSSVSYTSPYLGGNFTMTIIGTTGTIGSAGIFSYTPATQDSWNADCLELQDSSIVMTGGNTGTFTHGLYQTGLASSSTNYTITYTFKAKCVTSSSTAVEPLSYISSGTQVKHTSVTNYGSLPPIAPAVNALVLTKSVSPASSTSGGTATYHIDVTNNGPSSATLDDFRDILPSSPASVSYINSSSTYDNDISDGSVAVTVPDPSASGQTITWVGSFAIPSGKTGRLIYQATIPSTAGSYINSAAAHSGSAQIDQTADTSDNVPGTATYGVGSINMASSTKTAADINGGSLQPGDIIEYTISAVNSGTSDATGVHISDTIDTNTNNLSNVVIGANGTDCGVSYANNTTTTTLDITGVSVPHGSHCDVTYRVTVKSATTAGTTILNSATIAPSNVGAINGTPSSIPMVVHKDPILSVTNTENDVDNVVTANQVITYTTTITNSGQGDASGVNLVGTITGPVGSLSARTLTNCGPNTTYVDTSSSLSINIAALTITTTNPCVISYTVTVNNGATSGSISNSADVSAAREGGNDPAAASASTLLIGAAATPPNLLPNITENDADGFVFPGQVVTYTIQIQNSGQTDASTSLTSSIPSGFGTPGSLTYTNCGSSSSSYSSGTLTITLIDIPAANFCTITFAVTVNSPQNEGTQLTVGADVAQASQGGNNPANVNATTLTIDATPILGITSAENDSDNIVSPSQDITYTITLSNTGDGQGTGIPLTDTFTGAVGSPSNFSFSNCGSSYANNSSSSVDITGLAVSVGTNCVITFHEIVNSNASNGSTITDLANISGATQGGNNPIPVSASTLTVTAPPTLAVTSAQNDNDNTVNPSQDITYTITIANSGGSSASGVGLSDPLTGSVGNVGTFNFTNCGSSYANNSSGTTVTLVNLSIASGASCVITFHTTVNSNAAAGSTITDSADTTAATEGGNNPATTSAGTLTVATVPNLGVTVADNDVDNVVTPAQTIQFTITIANTGNGTGTTSTAVSIPSSVGSPSSIQFTNCGSAGSSFSNPTLSLTSLTVTTSASCVITFNETVNSPNTAGATFVVGVNVAAASQGGNDPANVDSSTFTIDTTPNLSSSTISIADHNGGNLAPGDTIDYTLTLINTGDGTATGVSAGSTLNTHVTLTTNTISLTNCGGSSSNNSTTSALALTNLQVTIGTNCVITFSGVLATPLDEGTAISGSATIGAATEGGTGASPTSNTLSVDATPALAVTSSENDSDNTVTTGQDITYTITITNSGNGTATGVSLSDPISGSVGSVGSFSLSNCGSSSSNTSSGSIVSLSALSIGPSTPCIVTFHVAVDNHAAGGSTITDSADASAAAEGGNNPGATSASTLTVATIPNLVVTVNDDDSDNNVAPGQTMQLTVNISNTGNGTGTTGGTVTIPSQLGSPSSIQFTNCGSPRNSYSSPTLTLTNLSVTTANNCVITFNEAVNSPNTNGATFNVSADIAAATQGGNNPASVNSDTFTIASVPDLTTADMHLTDANGGTLAPGDTITYTITIPNTGNSNATGLSLSASIASDALIDTGSIQYTGCGSGVADFSDSGSLSLANLQIAVNASCSVSFNGILSTPLNEGTVVDGSATITAPVEGGSGVNLTANTLTIDATPNLSTSTISGSDLNGATLKPGDRVGYTVTVKNTGNGLATGVAMSDTVNTNTNLDTSSIQFTNCGSSHNSTSTTTHLSLTGLQVAIGTNCVVYFETVLHSPLNEGTVIGETVTIAPAAQGGVGGSPSSSALTVDATPQLGVTLSDDDSDNIVNPGQTLNMQAVITNSGDGRASGVSFTYTLGSPGENLTSIITSSCGSGIGQSSTSTSLNFANLQINAGSTCTISFAFNVANSASNGATIDQSLNVGAASEGGNDPNTVNASTLTVNISNVAPNVPANVTSTLLSGNHQLNNAAIGGAQLLSTLSDPNAGDQVRYRLQFATDNGFTNVVIDYQSTLGVQGNHTYTYQENSGTYLTGSHTTLLADGTYYVRIRAQDDSNASSAWYVLPGIAFTYDTTAPAKPNKPFVIGSVGVSTVTVGWDTSSDPNPNSLIPYRLEYSTTPDFSSFSDIDTANLSNAFTGLNADTHYYFRIYLRDAAGNLSEASDILDVHIPAASTTPTSSSGSSSKKTTNSKTTSTIQSSAGTTPPPQSEVSPAVSSEGETTKVTIYVRDDNNHPIQGAKVTLHSQPRIGYADKDGLVVFYGVPIGEHTATVEYNNITATTPVSLKSGVQELSVTLTLKSFKKSHHWCWLWWLLILVIIYLLWRYYRRRREKRKAMQQSQKDKNSSAPTT